MKGTISFFYAFIICFDPPLSTSWQRLLLYDVRELFHMWNYRFLFNWEINVIHCNQCNNNWYTISNLIPSVILIYSVNQVNVVTILCCFHHNTVVTIILLLLWPVILFTHEDTFLLYSQLIDKRINNALVRIAYHFKEIVNCILYSCLVWPLQMAIYNFLSNIHTTHTFHTKVFI